MLKQILFFSAAILLFSSCSQDPYRFDRYYSAAEQDTLMANIITYVYKVPRGVPKSDKFDPTYRSLYVAQIPLFEMLHYHIDEDSTHYFYMIRPARNAQGHKRGVAGSYKVNRDLSLKEFRELYNTPMIPEELVREKGEYLWRDLVKLGNVDRYMGNRDFIEFPNQQCTYDFDKKEWVY